MKTEIAPHSSDSVSSLIRLLGDIAANIVAAGEMLARLHAEDEDVIQKVVDEAPGLSPAFLRQLLRVGERSLHPNILLNGCPAYSRLAFMPYSTQEQVIRRKSIELVVDAETGDTLRVPVTDLTPAQVSQVIGQGGVRSRDDQRAFLKQRAAAQRIENTTRDITGPSYVIRKGQLVVLRPASFTPSELARIMGEIVA